jgi:hypothetical protein
MAWSLRKNYKKKNYALKKTGNKKACQISSRTPTSIVWSVGSLKNKVASAVFQPLHWGWSLQVLFLLLAGLVKIFPDFRCNLAICHLFNCFHSLDEMSETVIF